MLGGEVPISISCIPSVEKCPYYVYEEDLPTSEFDFGVSSSFFTKPPTTLTKECVKCIFTYSSATTSTCQDFSCDEFNCINGDERRLQTEQDTDAVQVLLRHDGVYKLWPDEPNSTVNYLRFYEDFTVIGVSSMETSDQISHWFGLSDTEHDIRSATYTIGDDDLVAFSLPSLGEINTSSFDRFDAYVYYDLLSANVVDSASGDNFLELRYDFQEVDFPDIAQNLTNTSTDDLFQPLTGTCRSSLYGQAQFGDIYKINESTGDLSLVATTADFWAASGATDSSGRFIAMQQYETGFIYEIDSKTGLASGTPVIGLPEYREVLSIAIDSNDTVYAVLEYDMWTIDYLGSGQASKILSNVGHLGGCAFDTRRGDMYCIEYDELVRMDLVTGAKTLVATVGDYDDMAYGQALEYDPCEDKLWMAYSGLASYDLSDGAVTEVSTLDARLFGLFVESQDVLPGPKFNETYETENTTVLVQSTEDNSEAFAFGGFFTESTPAPTHTTNQPATLLPTSPPANIFDLTTSSTTSQPTPSPTRPGPDDVRVCMEYSRVDYFAVNEFRQGDMYGCSFRTHRKEHTVDYSEGVSNVHETMYTMGDAGYSSHTGEDDTLGGCTYQVDGVDCRSCKLCDELSFHLDGFEADCSNIVAGAKTSCDIFFDTIDAHLFILKENYVYVEPTSPPKTTSAPRTSAPESSSGSGPTEEKNGKVAAIIIPIVIILVCLGLCNCYWWSHGKAKKNQNYKKDVRSPGPALSVARATQASSFPRSSAPAATTSSSPPVEPPVVTAAVSKAGPQFQRHVQTAKQNTERAVVTAKPGPLPPIFAHMPPGRAPKVFPPGGMGGPYVGAVLSAPPDDGVYPNLICITTFKIREPRGWIIQGEGMADPQGPFDLHGLAADDGTAYWVQVQKGGYGKAFRVIYGNFDLETREFVGQYNDCDGNMGIVTMKYSKTIAEGPQFVR